MKSSASATAARSRFWMSRISLPPLGRRTSLGRTRDLPGRGPRRRPLYSARVFRHPPSVRGVDAVPQDQLSNDLASLRIDRAPAAATGRRVPAGLIWVIVLGALGAAAYFVGYPMLQSAIFKAEVK